jgi:ATP-dependent DNA ligase
MTQDKEVPNTLKFFCFDTLDLNNPNEHFISRVASIPLQSGLIKVEQTQVNLPNDKDFVKELFLKRLEDDYEGLIIKRVDCPYKYGRGTIKEGYVFKYKPFETHDAKIVEVIQATEVRKGAEKKINELGNSVTSKKKDDRVLIEKASAFMVDFNGLRFKVSIAENDEEKKKIWENREGYIGAWVEFEAMFIGVKNAPRHPITKRMRWDR